MATRHVLVVVNPAAGGDPFPVAAALTDRYTARAHTVTTISTEFPGHAEQIAAGLAGAGDIVVAVGGDGTVRDVAAGLYRAHRGHTRAVPALLMAPGGTGNSSYLGIWGDRPWQDVLDLVFGSLGSTVRWLDLALVCESERLVLLGAGSGLLAEALVTAKGLDDPPSRQRYQRALLETMSRFRPYPGRVCIDSVPLSVGPALMVAVGGGRYRGGGGYLLLPQSELDDGLLDVCVVEGHAPPLEMTTLAATGRHLDHPAVRYAQGREITVERTDGANLIFENDGDVDTVDGPGRTLRVLPQSVPVVMPTAG